MKITLAIPNYNGLENLKILIPEVLKEGFEQIYVLDDKSTDDSINYLTKHFPQIKVIKGEINLGPAGNRILEQSYGEIIMFLDEVKLLPDKINQCSGIMVMR
ncbi:MAG: glycosyltransferase [Candidatus Daviesbacteria bacterium]|nr:glycosyltransferase [Candidatus Daviesbacteria bacterium]